MLEIGTGSGYQSAVLGELARRGLLDRDRAGARASRRGSALGELGYHNVDVREGDGYRGWPEQAPFDAIIVTAAPDRDSASRSSSSSRRAAAW